MAFNNFPQNDLNTTNLDWLIAKYISLNGKIDDGLVDYINSQLGDLFAETSYNPATETLTIKIQLGGAGNG